MASAPSSAPTRPALDLWNDKTSTNRINPPPFVSGGVKTAKATKAATTARTPTNTLANYLPDPSAVSEDGEIAANNALSAADARPSTLMSGSAVGDSTAHTGALIVAGSDALLPNDLVEAKLREAVEVSLKAAEQAVAAKNKWVEFATALAFASNKNFGNAWCAKHQARIEAVVLEYHQKRLLMLQRANEAATGTASLADIKASKKLDAAALAAKRKTMQNLKTYVEKACNVAKVVAEPQTASPHDVKVLAKMCDSKLIDMDQRMVRYCLLGQHAEINCKVKFDELLAERDIVVALQSNYHSTVLRTEGEYDVLVAERANGAGSFNLLFEGAIPTKDAAEVAVKEINEKKMAAKEDAEVIDVEAFWESLHHAPTEITAVIPTPTRTPQRQVRRAAGGSPEEASLVSGTKRLRVASGSGEDISVPKRARRGAEDKEEGEA